MGIIYFADADKKKKQMQENFHLFLLNFAQRLTQLLRPLL
jgi:hypothetical protein